MIVQSASRFGGRGGRGGDRDRDTGREDTEDVMLVRGRMVVHQESLRLHCKLSMKPE